MIAAAWRQQRLVVLVALATVGALSIWLAVTGTLQENAWAADEHASAGSCIAEAGSRCAAVASRYDDLVNLGHVSLWLLIAVPGLLGLVVGGPLVAREIEQRTNRVAWTQSITRTRWLAVKLGVGALACAAIVAALAPLAEWWTGATQHVPRIEPMTFDVAGVAPIAYGLFAFALGAALGAVVRRSGWAFALGVPCYAAVRLLVRRYVRPGLVAPTDIAPHTTSAGDGFGSTVPAGWDLQTGFVPVGRTSPPVGQSWPAGEGRIDACSASLVRMKDAPNEPWNACVAKLHLHLAVQVQPPSHFWPIELLEAAIYVGFALGLCGVAVLAVRRWRT